MPVLYDARGNEYLGAPDQITGTTLTDARSAVSGTLGALNAESLTDLNGQAVWLVDARTAAASLTFVAEGTVDGVNYSVTPLNMYDTAAPTVAVTSVVITTTLAKQYYVSVGGYRRVRIRVSAYTSGGFVVATRATIAGFTDVLAGPVNIGPSVVPGVGATNLGKSRTAAPGATDTGVAGIGRAVTSATAVTNGQYDLIQLEAATGAQFVNSPVNTASGITKQRAAAPGATDSGVSVLYESLAANTAVTAAQYHRPQVEASTGAEFVHDVPSTLNGLTINHLVVAATTNATSAKGSAGNLYGWSISNKSAAVQFFKLFNKATAPTVGTDVPVITVAVPALSTVVGNFDKGLSFATGIAYAYTNLIADLDTTVVVAGDAVINLFYK